MKKFYVYILKISDDSYYTGVTSNLERRLTEHEAGKDPQSYTATRLPLKIVYYEVLPRPKMAIDFEKQVKGWSRKKKEALIERSWDRLKELSVCRNETHYSCRGFGSTQPDVHSAQASTPLSLTGRGRTEGSQPVEGRQRSRRQPKRNQTL